MRLLYTQHSRGFMDPITQAIFLGVAGNFTTDAVKAAYKALLDAFNSKFGQNSDVVDAVNKLEKTPDRPDRQATVKVEVENAKANEDAQLVQLAQKVINLVEQQPGGKEAVNNITQNIQTAFKSAISGTGDATIHNN